MICKRRLGLNGFTMIELLITVSVLAILVSTGVAVFTRSIRGSSADQIRKTLYDRSRLTLRSISEFLRSTKAISLDGNDRDSCLNNGTMTGDALVVQALDGLTTTISVSTPSGQIASASATGTVYLNPDGAYTVWKSNGDAFFVWTCLEGAPDKLSMRFRATAVGAEGETSIGADHEIEVILRNSGR